MRYILLVLAVVALIGSLVGLVMTSHGILADCLFLASVLGYLPFCFTFVKEGTAKNVVRFGGYRKTLLAKIGYKLDKNGNVVELAGGEKPQYPVFLGGLRWVSLLKPLGIDRIYKRTMKYVKALPDGNFENRADPDTDFILAGTQYQYGLEFKSAEDQDKLPLSGRMTMSVVIVNPYRALFLVKDWFDALVGRVLPRVREYISEHEYDKIINDRDTQLDRDVFAMLNQTGPNGEPSIVFILREQYGIELLALETVNIDPPEGYREATLAKWKAQQEADRDMEQTAGRLLKSVARVSGLTQEELAEKLKADPTLRGKYASEGGFREAFADAVDQLKRDRAGASGDLRDIRIGSVDGTPFGRASIGEIVGGFAAAFAAKDSGGGRGGGGGGGKGNRGSGKGKKPKNMNMDEAITNGEED